MNSHIEKKQVSRQELKTLYKKWPDIRRFMKTLGCSTTNAEDIFQEALLIYTRRCSSDDFELTVEPYHYVKSTCKLLWYNQSRKEGKRNTDQEFDDFQDEQDDWMQKEMRLQRIEHAISKIGQQCQELLKLFYGKGWNMSDIAQKMGLRNDKVAKAQKYRCINKVKEEVSLMGEFQSIHETIKL